jgi:hypothetical protein
MILRENLPEGKISPYKKREWGNPFESPTCDLSKGT